MQSSHSHIARISRRITPTPGHDHRFSGMLFFPSLFRSRSAIRSRDLPPISPRCARDQTCASWRSTMLIPFATRPGAAHVLAFHARRGSPLLLLALSHPAPRPPSAGAATGQATSSSPAAAYLRTWLIAAASSHEARLSNRWNLSGVRSPACSPTDHPFRDGKSLASADTYFPSWRPADKTQNVQRAAGAVKQDGGDELTCQQQSGRNRRFSPGSLPDEQVAMAFTLSDRALRGGARAAPPGAARPAAPPGRPAVPDLRLDAGPADEARARAAARAMLGQLDKPRETSAALRDCSTWSRRPHGPGGLTSSRWSAPSPPSSTRKIRARPLGCRAPVCLAHQSDDQPDQGPHRGGRRAHRRPG